MEEPGIFSTLFSPIEFLFTSILNFFYHLTESAGFGSYGVAIILLTVLMKVLLYPLTVKQLQSMKAMQQIQPKMQRLQEKYKDNPQLMQQKMMKLYQDAGVNPMAGCLPILAQMPILMAMYYTLFNFDYGNVTPSFLWLPNLSDTFGNVNFRTAKSILRCRAAQCAVKNFYDNYADFYRLDKYKFSGGSCTLLGHNEYGTDVPATLDLS